MKTHSFAGVMLCFALLLPANVLHAQIGKRQKLKGAKSAPAVPNTPQNVIRIADLQLTPAKAEAWSNMSRDELVKQLPPKPSLFVIGKFKGFSDDFVPKIKSQYPNSPIVESSNHTVVLYAGQEDARQLMRTMESVDIIEALPAQKKLTGELKELIARKGENKKLDESVKGNKLKALKVVPEGTAPNLAAEDASGPAAPVQMIPVTIYLFKGQPTDAIGTAVQNSSGTVTGSGSDANVSVVRAVLPASRIEQVAGSMSVREITLDAEFIKHNDVAENVLVRNPPAYVPPILGEDEIVGHADSGLDNGKNDNTLHPSFRGRVKQVFALGRPAANDWTDRGGHGTHTAGSILGGDKFPGIAPKAKLVHQSLDDNNGALRGIPTPLSKLFEQAYGAGARTHSNSWGVSAIVNTSTGPVNQNGGVYMRGEEVDTWSWNNGQPRDMLIVFSAGNDGRSGKTTVTSPGTAKNCLTVGACENLRPDGGSDGDNTTELANFSSVGPTRENRIKPDVVAPGTWIASARTQAAKVVWTNDIESATTGSAGSDWQVTPGFQLVNNPAGGAFNGTHAWRLSRAMGATFQDVLKTPEVILPGGHELSFELWIRGTADSLDSLQIGFEGSDGLRVYPNIARRNFGQWTSFTGQLPGELQGTPVRLAVVAQEQTGLDQSIALFVDQFRLTTFGSWGAVSTLNLAGPDDATDKQFTFDGGTSMAAPLTAGCVALVRQSLIKTGTANPSAELVKAILINSADAHPGAEARPNFHSGWGLVNLKRAIEGEYNFDFDSTLKDSESMTYDVPVAAGATGLRVSLVWADAPGAKLVNDLDLKLTSPAGVDTLAADPDGNSPDRINNVEGIDVKNPAVGTWKVTVTAHKVTPGLSQPYTFVSSALK